MFGQVIIKILIWDILPVMVALGIMYLYEKQL